MKKIKRWLGGLCCAALLLALLTACGSQTPQQVQPTPTERIPPPCSTHRMTRAASLCAISR